MPENIITINITDTVPLVLYRDLESRMYNVQELLRKERLTTNKFNKILKSHFTADEMVALDIWGIEKNS